MNIYNFPTRQKKSYVFFAELSDGEPLPRGLICTSDGKVQGIPAAGTQGIYQVVVVAENEDAEPTRTLFSLTIHASLAARVDFDLLPDEKTIRDLKQRVWDAIGHNQPIPDIGDLFIRPVRALDVLYLLERWSAFAIWDVNNYYSAEQKQLLDLKGCSLHYQIYDDGNALVTAPKDLFSHERTMEDGLQTVRAMAHEVYTRGWDIIEFTGSYKMQRMAWVELQILAIQHGRELKIMHYTPIEEDAELVLARAAVEAPRPESG